MAITERRDSKVLDKRVQVRKCGLEWRHIVRRNHSVPSRNRKHDGVHHLPLDHAREHEADKESRPRPTVT